MWLENRKHEDIKIVFYEDLQLDIVREVLGILKFIGMKPQFDRINCLEKFQNKTFKRNRYINGKDKLTYFSASQKFLISKHVKMLNATLVKNNQNQLLKSYIDFTNFRKIQFDKGGIKHFNMFRNKKLL